MFDCINLSGKDVRSLLQTAERAYAQHDYATAEQCYRWLMQKDKKQDRIKFRYIETLMVQYKYDQAKQALQKIVQKGKVHGQFIHLRARLSLDSGDFEQAEADTKLLIKAMPTMVAFHYLLANIYRTFRKPHLAREAYLKTLSLDADHGDAYRLLRGLGKATDVSEEDQQVIVKVETQKDVHPGFHFGLGYLFDDLGDYERAWDHFQLANNLSLEQINLQKEKDNTESPLQSGEYLRNEIEQYLDSDQCELGDLEIPALLVAGFPRSGTTLLENVFAADEHFRGCGELKIIDWAESALRTRLQAGEKVNADLIDEYCSFYRSNLNNLNIGDSIAVDKGLQLIRTAGLLIQGSPTLRMVVPIRDPQDTLLSNYKEYFPHEMAYSYDPAACIDSMRFFFELAKLWKERFPDRVKLISYEDYVAAPEMYNRRFSKWMSGDEAHYSFGLKASAAPVRTATATQLGAEVRTSSTGRSAPYAAMLKPWGDALNELKQYMPSADWC